MARLKSGQRTGQRKAGETTASISRTQADNRTGHDTQVLFIMNLYLFGLWAILRLADRVFTTPDWIVFAVPVIIFSNLIFLAFTVHRFRVR